MIPDPIQPSQPTPGQPGANLLINPNAETGECTTSGYDGMTIPGWTVVTGAPDSVCYGTVGFPRTGIPGPTDAGKAMFAGGATGNAVLTQQVSLAAGADEIDRGGVSYDLSGWLGGFAAQDDRVGLSATFLDPAGSPIGLAQIQPVSDADRNSVTELLRRAKLGFVPPGTRSVAVTLTFTWTAGDTTDGYADDLTFATSLNLPAAKLAVPQSAVPPFDHVFMVFMENENAVAQDGRGDYIGGNPAAGYINRTLVAGSAQLAEMFATTHPSDPNYLAVTGGSTFGWTTNPVVGRDRIEATNIGDKLDAAGKTWAGYADGAHGACDMTSHNTAKGGYYLPDDEPFMMYADIADNPARCAQHNLPLAQLGADLTSTRTTPAFVWFAANDVDSMEDGAVAAGDQWLSRVLPRIYASPAWTDQRSLLIVSWDEGSRKDFGPEYPNHIPTFIAASQGLVKVGYTSNVRYTDYSLAATIEAALGIGALTSNDEYAARINDIWTTPNSGGGTPPGSKS